MKRIVLSFLSCLWLPALVSAQITYSNAHTGASSTTGYAVTTTAITTPTDATLLVACVQSYLPNVPAPTLADSVSGSASNTWIAFTTTAPASFLRGQLYYALNPTHLGANHTFTVSGPSVSVPSVIVAAF